MGSAHHASIHMDRIEVAIVVPYGLERCRAGIPPLDRPTCAAAGTRWDVMNNLDLQLKYDHVDLEAVLRNC